MHDFDKSGLHGTVEQKNSIGQITSEINYWHGIPHGICKFYDPKTQKVTCEMMYYYGKLDGDKFNYDSLGRLVRHTHYNNGIMITNQTMNLRSRRHTGVSFKYYYSNGKCVKEECYKIDNGEFTIDVTIHHDDD